MNFPYKRQNPYIGALLFFISKKRFIEIAVQHGMAINLESEDQKKCAEERGDEVLPMWKDTYQRNYSEMTYALNSALWSSFWIIFLLIILAVTIAYFFGRIHLVLPFDWARFTTFLGSTLVGWGTLMELGNDFTVWDGPSFPQLAHKIIFKSIFIPGVLLILISILM